MTNRKTTRRALVLSLLSLLVCCSMLVGTTFAWFTDSVTTGNNKIVAGNLDIELEYSKDMSEGSWKTVSNATDLFSDTLWEPGHTQVVYLKLSNLGTLALKYNFSMNFTDTVVGTSVEGNEIKLSEHLKYDIVDVTAKYADRDAAREAVEDTAETLAAYSVNGEMLPGADPKVMALVIYMPETVGNEANYRGTAAPQIDLGLNLLATQVEAELDSFGPDYDADAAEYSIYTFDTPVDLMAFDPANFNPANTAGSGLEVVDGKAVVNAKGAFYYKEVDLTKNEYTVEYDVDVTALTVGESVTFNTGDTATWSANTPVTVTRGSAIVAIGGDQPVEKTFEGMLLHVTHVYALNADGVWVTTTTVTDGVDSISTSKKQQNYPGTGNNLFWDVEGVTEAGKVTLDNFQVTKTAAKVDSAAELASALAAGGTVKLTTNITASEMIEIPAGVKVTLDLNGHEIAAGYQEGSASKHEYALNNFGDLTLEGGVISGRGIYNRDGATLTVNGTEINAVDYNGGACIWSYGTGKVIVNDAKLTGNTGVISSEGPVEINGGTYICHSGIDDNGSQVTAPTYNIRAYNGLKITDGTFTSRHGVISVGGGEAVIEGGDYTIEFAAATTSNVVYVYGSTDMTINGGSFISDNTSGKADSGAAVVVSGSDAKVTINDGTFVGMNGMVSGNVTLYGGNFNTVWNYNHYDKLADKLAEDYAATQGADGSWTVHKDTVTGIVSTDVKKLEETVEDGGDVLLLGDVAMEAATPAPYGNKVALIQNGGVIDGNGNELYMECYGDDYGIMTSGGTVKNLTIKEGCRAVMIMYPTEDVILDNVNIGGDGVLYPINTGEAGSEGVDLIVTNSVLAGWTSYSNIASASFTNVQFKQGTYYNNIYGRVLKPYVNTTLTNCSFVEHMNLDLSGLAQGQKVTIVNCTVNGQAVTADVFTIPSTDAQYDTELFTVDLPSWASSITDCVVFG